MSTVAIPDGVLTDAEASALTSLVRSCTGLEASHRSVSEQPALWVSLVSKGLVDGLFGRLYPTQAGKITCAALGIAHDRSRGEVT